MDEWFELWDSENSSLVGSYDTQSAALGVVRSIVESAGIDSTTTLVLTRETNADKEPVVLGAGKRLLDLARREHVSPFA